MIIVLVRDPQTGTSSIPRLWRPNDDVNLPSRQIAWNLLEDARTTDDTGGGVEIIVQIGGAVTRQHLGSTPYAGDDGMHQAAWVDLAEAILIGAQATEAAIFNTA